MAKSRVAQIRRLGRESTPGTAVAADFIDPHLKLMIALAGPDSVRVVPTGYMFPTTSVPGMYWGGGTYDVPFSFSTIHVVLDSLFKTVTATGATLTKTRVYTPAVSAVDTVQFYSGESGQTGAIEFYKYLFFNSLKAKIAKQGGSNLTGDVLAQVQSGFLGTAFTTGSPTVLPSSIVPAIAWNAYNATTFAGLAASPTQLTDQFEYDLNYGPVRETAAFIGSSNPGWDAPGIGEAPKQSVNVTVPKDVSSTSYAGVFTLEKKRAGTPIFIRLSAQGNLIETVSSVDYYEQIILDCVLRIMGNPKDSNVGPFVGQTWPTELSVDATSGKALQITVINGVA